MEVPSEAGSSPSDQTAFVAPVDTYATCLLAQALISHVTALVSAVSIWRACR